MAAENFMYLLSTTGQNFNVTGKHTTGGLHAAVREGAARERERGRESEEKIKIPSYVMSTYICCCRVLAAAKPEIRSLYKRHVWQLPVFARLRSSEERRKALGCRVEVV
jgi:hypothetical protein